MRNEARPDLAWAGFGWALGIWLRQAGSTEGGDAVNVLGALTPSMQARGWRGAGAWGSGSLARGWSGMRTAGEAAEGPDGARDHGNRPDPRPGRWGPGRRQEVAPLRRNNGAPASWGCDGAMADEGSSCERERDVCVREREREKEGRGGGTELAFAPMSCCSARGGTKRGTALWRWSAGGVRRGRTAAGACISGRRSSAPGLRPTCEGRCRLLVSSA